jgi:hypothetical protein
MQTHTHTHTIEGTHLEIYVPVLVHVECTKYMVAEFLSITAGEKHLVHVNKLRWC